MTTQLDLFRPDDHQGAEISECGRYRYRLWRKWTDSKHAMMLLFIMLNPSKADATHDDPTIRRCIGFAKAWGFSGIIVANLFAIRATRPSEMDYYATQGIDPVGPDNDAVLAELSKAVNVTVVFAWGCFPQYKQRMEKVISLFPDALAINISKDGYPNHPLYLPSYLKPKKFRQ